MNAGRITSLRADVPDRDQLIPDVSLTDLLRDIAEKLRRRWLLLVVFLAGGVAFGTGYALLATPVFTANGAILIDPRTGQTPETGEQLSSALLMSDALTVDSELRVLTSREVTASAVRALGLQPEPDPGPTLLQKLEAALGLKVAERAEGLSPAAEEARKREALRRAFMQNMEVTRSGESFVLDVAYASTDREFAAIAVNTLMQEYLRLSGSQQTALIERNRAWLEGRIAELGTELRAAETAVAAYRRENDLVAPEGQPLASEVALNAATAELVSLRSQALALQVQVDQIDDQIAAGAVDAILLTPEHRTPSLAEFERRHAELQQEEQELLLDWPPTAIRVVTARQQLAQTQTLILEEYQEIRDRLAAASEAMARRVGATEQVIADLSTRYGDDAKKVVDLRSLEREADAKRELYEQLLEEFQSASQLLTFDATSARVIAWAVPPDTKSAPRSRQIVALSAFTGLVLALTAVFLRDALDKTWRRPRDLSRETGLPILGLVPAFGSEKLKGGSFWRASGRPPAHKRGRWALLPKPARWLDFAARFPTSRAAQTLCVLHAQLANRRVARRKEVGLVLGFTSSVEGEGKTTTAANFASLLAHREERVALVDLDLTTRHLSRLVQPILPRANGLSALVAAPETQIGQLEPIPEFPRLTVIAHSEDGRGSGATPRDAKAIGRLFEALRTRFDYIVVDLPPSNGTAETQLLTPLCDQLIYTVRWGHTPKSKVIAALRQNWMEHGRIFGVLFTRAPVASYQAYNRHAVSRDHV